MELKCLSTYWGPMVDLATGETTVGRELPEEEKLRLLTTFPDQFEVIEEVIVTPEDKLVIETPEDKMGKLRKK